MSNAFGCETGMASSRIDLDLPLKGERPYLHSTSILAELIRIFTLTGAVKLEVRQMTYKPIFIDADDPERPDRAGRFAFKKGDNWVSYGLYLDNTRAITSRIPSNEPEILANSDIGEDAASCPIGAPANFLDTIVALNKVLVGRHSNGKKSIFSAIELAEVPGTGTIGVHLTKKLGSRLFVSDILWNGTKVGTLTFMAV
jgi:hypothetical protein